MAPGKEARDPPANDKRAASPGKRKGVAEEPHGRLRHREEPRALVRNVDAESEFDGDGRVGERTDSWGVDGPA